MRVCLGEVSYGEVKEQELDGFVRKVLYKYDWYCRYHDEFELSNPTITFHLTNSFIIAKSGYYEFGIIYFYRYGVETDERVINNIFRLIRESESWLEKREHYSKRMENDFQIEVKIGICDYRMVCVSKGSLSYYGLGYYRSTVFSSW